MYAFGTFGSLYFLDWFRVQGWKWMLVPANLFGSKVLQEYIEGIFPRSLVLE